MNTSSLCRSLKDGREWAGTARPMADSGLRTTMHGCWKAGKTAFAGSQPGHRFPAPGGSRRTRTDTKERQFEFRRASPEPPGHLRTCNQHGSGP
jgi:hypothetical protein